MIKNPEVAKQVLDTLYQMMEELKNLIRSVEQLCEAPEYEALLRATAPVAGAMLSVVEQIYEAHPEMKPKEWEHQG